VGQDSQWGASHLWRNPFSGDSPAGVISVLRVPVFEGASGLGYRLPNFITTNVGSFLILFSNWLPAHVLSFMYMWLAIVVCWSTFDLVGRSWNERNGSVLRLWFSALIALVVFSWLLENNWSICLAGMLGVVSTTVSLFHRGFYEEGPAPSASATQAFSLLIGSVMLLAGSHPRYSLTLVPVLIWRLSTLRAIGRLSRSNPALIVIAMAGLLFTMTVLILELRSLKIPTSEIPDPRQNNFDFLYQSGDFGDWRQFLRSLALNTALPFFLLTKRFGFTEWFDIQYEFVNSGVLLWLVIAWLKTRNRTPQSRDRRLALRSSSAAIGTFLVWMTLTTESTSFPTVIRILFKADAYDLHFPAATLVMVVVMIGSPGLGKNSIGSGNIVRLGRLSASTGIVACLCFPFVALANVPTLNGTPAIRDMSSGILDSVTQDEPPPGRLAAVLPYQRCRKYFDQYLASAGISHPTVASRIGIATAEGLPRYRIREISIGGEGCPSLTLPSVKCNAKAFDFLSIGLIVERPVGLSCRWLKSVPTLLEYFKDNGESPAANPERRYGNFYFSANDLRRSFGESCVILGDCLDNVTRTSATQVAPPWRLCERGCWFRYVVVPERSKTRPWLLLPAHFDSAVEVRAAGEVDTLPIANYRGLLAVRVSPMEEPKTLVVKIKPDSQMYRISLVPYASLATYVAISLTLYRSSRSRQQSEQPL